METHLGQRELGVPARRSMQRTWDLVSETRVSPGVEPCDWDDGTTVDCRWKKMEWGEWKVRVGDIGKAAPIQHALSDE